MAALVACALVPAPAAQATYPGRNGSIAFNSVETVSEFEVLSRTEAIRPDETGRHVLADFGSPSWSASGAPPHWDRLPGPLPERRTEPFGLPPTLQDGVVARFLFPTPSRAAGPVVRRMGRQWSRRRCSAAPAPSPDGLTHGPRHAGIVTSHLDRQSTGTNIPWIWTVRMDGSGPREVRGVRPRWTPDGRRIVFQRIGLYGQANSIASMRPDGTGFRRVLVSAGGDPLPRTFLPTGAVLSGTG